MSQTEGRIALALQAYQQGQFSSLQAAVNTYNVPRSTLTNRYNGITSHSNSRSPNHKLTQTEETVLIEWILSLDTYSIPLIQSLIYRIAKLLLRECIQNALIEETILG